MTLKQRILDSRLSIVKINGGWSHELLDLVEECQGRTPKGIAKVFIKRLGLKDFDTDIVKIRQLGRVIFRNKYRFRDTRDEKTQEVLAIYSELSWRISKRQSKAA